MNPTKSHAYRPDIDGLRAIAVLSVLAYHGFPTVLPGGVAGVDVFFVISGFLISGIILREIKDGTFSILNFYARRVRRIFPGLVLVLAVSLVAGWVILFADEFRQLGKHVVGSVAFGLNVLLTAEAGYFDTHSDYKVLLHLWSLGVEEQYYFVWPLVAFALARSRRRLLAVVVFAIALSFAYNVMRVAEHQSSTFFLPFSRAWELLLGSVIAFRWPGRGGQDFLIADVGLGGLREVSGWSGLALLVGSMEGLNSSLPFPGWYAALPAAGAALLIVAGPGSFVSRRILSQPLAVGVGLISYPLYLWHWPLLAYARILAAGQPPSVVVALCLSVSVLLAWVTYRFVELQVRSGGARVVPALIGGAAAMVGIGLFVYLGNGLVWRKPQAAGLQNLEGRFEAFRNALPSCPPHLAPGTPLSWCKSSGSQPPELALIGDSHADHFFPGLILAAPRRSMLLVGEESCPPALGIVAGVRGVPEFCSRAVPSMLELVLRERSITTIVVAFLGPYYISDENVAANHVGFWHPSNYVLSDADGASTTKREALEKGLIKLLKTLVAAGKDVVVVVDVPEMPFMPGDCFQRFQRWSAARDCSLSETEVRSRQRDYRSMLASIQREVPQIRFFDPLPFMCRDGRCSMLRDGISLYRDSHHLSLDGSRLLGAHLLDVVGDGH